MICLPDSLQALLRVVRFIDHCFPIRAPRDDLLCLEPLPCIFRSVDSALARIKHKYPVFFFQTEGNDLSFIFEESQTLFHHFPFFSPVLFRPEPGCRLLDLLVRDRFDLFVKKSMSGFQRQDPADRLIDPLLGNLTIFHHFDDIVDAFFKLVECV